MKRGARRDLRVGRIYPERTTRFDVPLLFWATGTAGIVVGYWRLWVVQRQLLMGGALWKVGVI